MSSMRRSALARIAGFAAEVLALGFVLLLAAGLAVGFRPVILLTGSMSPVAPEGSLIIVSDVPRSDVAVDDIIVIDLESHMLLTHRVVELSGDGDQRVAVTKGDANPTVDPTVHKIEAEQAVVRFVVPVLGSWLLPIANRSGAIAIAAGLLIGLALLIQARRMLKNSITPPIGNRRGTASP